jgi:hypothetical protein
MHFRLSEFLLQCLFIASSLNLLANSAIGECVLAKPVRVRQICGQIQNEKGFSWPSSLRLTKQNKTGETNTFEQTITTDEDGHFTFKDIPTGRYELRVTPGTMREVFVPVLVDYVHPRRDHNCAKPIELKISFLPETCVSYKLQKNAR